MMRQAIFGAIAIGVLAAAPAAFADEGNLQKVCVIPLKKNGPPALVPVPPWATRDLCEQLSGALPHAGGAEIKLGCMVGPGESDFAPQTFHIVGPNRGNPCHWPFVGG